MNRATFALLVTAFWIFFFYLDGFPLPTFKFLNNPIDVFIDGIILSGNCIDYCWFILGLFEALGTKITTMLIALALVIIEKDFSSALRTVMLGLFASDFVIWIDLSEIGCSSAYLLVVQVLKLDQVSEIAVHSQRTSLLFYSVHR